MSFSISGKTAIVTGAASGIGLAIARQFMRAGANVMFTDANEKLLTEELGELTGEHENVRYFAGDLRERLTAANLLSATVDAFDRIDILINGARQMASSDALDPDDESVAAMLDQNLMTTLRLSQMAARRMIRHDQENGTDDRTQIGAIVNLSSIAARRTHPEMLGYSISSAALDQMTRSLAVALAPHRIRVNAVAFGSVMSASLQEALKAESGYRQDIEQHTPLGRIASPDELADTVQFLASDAARFMTGQVLTLDGGRTLLDPVTVPAH